MFSKRYKTEANFKAGQKEISFLILAFAFLIMQNCSSDKQEAVNPATSAEEALDILRSYNGKVSHLSGKQLALIYCQVCHLYPEPSLLDRSTWEKNVLPDMGLRMGVKTKVKGSFFSGKKQKEKPSGPGYAQEQLISEADWNKIREFYRSGAPENPVPQKEKTAVKTGMVQFKVRQPQFQENQLPLTTMLRFNEQNGRLYAGSRHNKLYVMNGSTLEVLDSIPTVSPPSDIHFKNNGDSFYLLTMGVMDPSDKAIGQLDFFSDGKGKTTTEPVLQKLVRPVQFVFADLNLDGQEDVVVCEFGNNSGKLVWYENRKGKYLPHVLNNLQGARRVIVRDMDKDNRPDLVVLMTQAQEGIYVYYNRKEGFEVKALVKFPPVYGSSDFGLADFNDDGAPDILYTCGDNADYSPVLKNYHGVRLFLNNGKNEFAEEWFYPVHGASRAIAEDFDQDGDLDIASISFFPDFKNAPQGSFIYFDNRGNLNFVPATFEAAPSGRWLSLESGDLDKDGDTDLILGSFIFGPTEGANHLQDSRKWKEIPYLVLENQLKPVN